jgi:hypothetical protein
VATDLGELLVKLSADIKSLETGLGNAKNELAGFQNYAQSFASSLKRALAFAGIATGLYELLSSLKQFASASIEVGRNIEVLRLGTYGLAEGLGMSMGVVDHWVEKMRSMGLSAEASWKTVQTALKTGIDLRQLDPLIKAIQNIAPLAGMSVNEAMEAVMRSIATGMPLALRSLEIPMALIRGLLRETGQDAEGVTKRFQMIADFLISYGNQMEGVAAKVGSSFAKQSLQLTNAAQQAKEALFDNFLKPFLSAITGEKIKAWSDLANWITQSGDKLKELGAGLGAVIARLMQMVLFIGKVIAYNPEWTQLVVTIWGGAKVLSLLVGPLVSIGAAFQKAAVQGGVLGAVVLKLRAMLMALVANPYVITVTIAVMAAAGVKKLYEKAPEAAPYALAGEAFGAMTPEQQAQIKEAGEAFKAAQAAKEEAAKPKEEITAERIAKETEEATKKALERLSGLAEGIGGKGGKGGKELHEDLLSYLIQYLEAKRQLEIKDADESYQTFKALQDKKKAELELALAEGKISGSEYHRAMIEMAQAEADAALKLIDTKIAKEKEAYEWGQKELKERAAAGEMSPEALDLALKKLQVEHAARLKDLEGEAGREKIKLQKELVDLVKQEYENRQKITEIMLSGEEQAALGEIAEKEAEIKRLLYERKKLKEELIRLGGESMVPEFDRLTKEIEFNKRFGDQIKAYTNLISGFFGDLTDAIMDGEKDLRQTLNKFFKSLFKQALEPALKQMMQWLTDFFKDLFGNLGSSIMNSLMAVVGLIGMFLTSGGGEATWTPAGVSTEVNYNRALRGVIAGETTIPIAEIGESLQDALVPTNSILSRIEENTRGLGFLQLNVNVAGLEEALRETLEEYFARVLMTGAPA